MKLNEQSYDLVSVHDLTPHPKNPNRGNAEVIKESIAENGFFGAIVAQKSTGHILIGHHRLQAAIGQGAEQVPVLWLDVDDRRALRVLLADNRTAEKAHRDEQALAELLAELNTADDLSGTGYSAVDLDALIQGMALPAADDWGDAMGKLSADDRQPFQQMTFTLHDEQAAQVKRAMDAARKQGPFTDSPNENGNGNALARICEAFLTMAGE